MENFIIEHLPNLNFIELVCIYVLFDVKNSINKLANTIDKLSDKVDKIDKIEQELFLIKQKLSDHNG